MTSKIRIWIGIVQFFLILHLDACADGYYEAKPCNDNTDHYWRYDTGLVYKVKMYCSEKDEEYTDFKCTAGWAQDSACSQDACCATCLCFDPECTAHCPTAGQYWNGDSCQNCGVGTYSPGSVTSCTSCGAGT